VGHVEESHKMNSNLYDIFVEKHTQKKERMNSEYKERGRKERKRLEI
jgi:hypothetical protein